MNFAGEPLSWARWQKVTSPPLGFAGKWFSRAQHKGCLNYYGLVKTLKKQNTAEGKNTLGRESYGWLGNAGL